MGFSSCFTILSPDFLTSLAGFLSNSPGTGFLMVTLSAVTAGAEVLSGFFSVSTSTFGAAFSETFFFGEVFLVATLVPVVVFFLFF